MNDLFATAGLALPVSPEETEDRLLATRADLTVIENLPPGLPEEFITTRIVRFDGAGPVMALTGTTLQCWGGVKRVLQAAWKGTPRAKRPPIMSMALPALDPARRRRIAHLAVSLECGR